MCAFVRSCQMRGFSERHWADKFQSREQRRRLRTRLMVEEEEQTAVGPSASDPGVESAECVQFRENTSDNTYFWKRRSRQTV